MKTKNLIVLATFILFSFSNLMAQTIIINSSAGLNGSISPSGIVPVILNGSQKFTITANVGYHISDVLVDGASIGAVKEYTFNNVVQNHSISAQFKIDTFIVTSSAGLNGNITPLGLIPVLYNNNQSFTITPNIGYHIGDVLVDGISVGAVNNYTFNNVIKNHSISTQFEIDTFSITSSAGLNGSITPLGLVPVLYNSNQKYKITPNEGYHILDVLVDGTSIGKDSSYTFNNVISNHTISAQFEIDTYVIQTNSNPIQGGVATGGGTFNYLATVNLVATPVTGYKFKNWTDNGIIVSLDSIYTFIATSNKTLISNFSIKEYSVSTTVLPLLSGTTSGDSTYERGSLVNIVATPKVGWKFVSWTESNQIVSVDSSYSFILFKDKSFIANFSKKIYTINAVSNPVTAGIISGLGSYEYDSAAVVVAKPNAGWDFINWTENNVVVFTDSSYSFPVLKSRNLTANYSKKTYLITTSSSPSESGITTGDSNYTYGDVVTVKAIANSVSGWKFYNWTENDVQVSSDSIYSFIAMSNRSLKANFQLKSYSLELFANPNYAGGVTGMGNYIYGTNVTITAVPADGWLFANWTEGDINISNDNTFNFNITDNRKITANFAHELYSIVGAPTPIDAGLVSGTGSFFFGQTATINASPNIGWDFNYWTENGSIVSENSSYQFVVSGDRNLLANYILKNYSIKCSASPIESGYTSGCGISTYGQEMNLTAVANSGWEFINWTENGDTVSTSPDFIFNVEGDRNLTANFDFISSVEKLDDLNGMPDTYYLSNAYPNPFNPSTKLNFGIPESSTVKIYIANINGEIVRALLSNVSLPAGNYYSKFDGDNLSSGIYFYIFLAQADNSKQSYKKVEKLILLK